MKRNIQQRTIVTPLPVLIVATYDESGTPNAMNAAWGGQCGYHEVALNLSAGHKTTENIRKNKAFTLSIGTVDTILLCDYFGLVSGRKENKIEKAGVHVEKSKFVNAPVITEFPLTMECEVISINDELGETRIVGRVVNLQAEETLFNESGKLNFSLLRPISYDSETHSYRELGGVIGKAFHDGSQLIK
jgi:flavin reductase (DIM6/NTAB) family NADH-FMN oxidoreductase RutF